MAGMEAARQQGRHLQIDLLRGIAALSVANFHLSMNASLTDPWLIWLGSLGKLGVEAFFAISGFVIPYALWRNNYDIALFGRFLLKRAIRIEPPFFASIALALLVGAVCLGAYFKWPSATRLLMHVAYLNAFTGDWISPVYWTLAIEFQYYLFIGLMFPILAHRSDRIALGALALLGLASVFASSEAFLLHWIAIFGMGILVFRSMAGLTPPHLVAAGLVLCAGAAMLRAGVLEGLAGLMAAMFILLVRIERPGTWFAPFAFLGTISYSFYLTHWDIGRAAVIAARDMPVVGGIELARLGVGMLCAIGVAWVFYWLVERPSLIASGQLSYEPAARGGATIPRRPRPSLPRPGGRSAQRA